MEALGGYHVLWEKPFGMVGPNSSKGSSTSLPTA